MQSDFTISLLDLDESHISNRQERQETAEEYVGEAMDKLQSIKNFSKEKKIEVSELKEEISLLQELRSTLETINDAVEVEE